MKEKIFALLCALSLLAGCAAAEHTKEASSDSVPETEASDDSEASDDPQTAGDTAAFRELFEIKAEGIDYLDVSGIRIPEGITISLVGKDASSGYWKQVHAGAQQAADDINAALGYTGDAKAELIYDASETGDVAEQIDIIDQMLDKNPDALIIGFVDVNSGKTQLELAESNGVPVFSVDSTIENSLIVSSSQTDNYQAGAEAARRLAELMGGSGQAAPNTFLDLLPRFDIHCLPSSVRLRPASFCSDGYYTIFTPLSSRILRGYLQDFFRRSAKQSAADSGRRRKKAQRGAGVWRSCRKEAEERSARGGPEKIPPVRPFS